MSRTKKRGGSKSPVKKYITFSGSTGVFKYWDKDKKENVELESLDITLLDVRASITGFNESLSGSNRSNLILDVKKEPFKVVVSKNGKINNVTEGLYDDIKPKMKSFNGKFTQNIFCLADVGFGEELVQLQLTGSALGGWIDLNKKHPNDGLDDLKITITKGALCVRTDGKNVPVTSKQEKALDATLAKNPRAPRPIWFYVLSFTTNPLTEDETSNAIDEDEKLQTYFETVGGTSYKRNDIDSPDPTAPEDEDGEEKDDLPF